MALPFNRNNPFGSGSLSTTMNNSPFSSALGNYFSGSPFARRNDPRSETGAGRLRDLGDAEEQDQRISPPVSGPRGSGDYLESRRRMTEASPAVPARDTGAIRPEAGENMGETLRNARGGADRRGMPGQPRVTPKPVQPPARLPQISPAMSPTQSGIQPPAMGQFGQPGMGQSQLQFEESISPETAAVLRQSGLLGPSLYQQSLQYAPPPKTPQQQAYSDYLKNFQYSSPDGRFNSPATFESFQRNQYLQSLSPEQRQAELQQRMAAKGGTGLTPISPPQAYQPGMGQPGMGQMAKVMPFLPGQQPGSTPRNIDTLPADFSPNPASQQILERLYQSRPMMTPEQVANMPGPSLAQSAYADLQFQRNIMQGTPGQPPLQYEQYVQQYGSPPPMPNASPQDIVPPPIQTQAVLGQPGMGGMGQPTPNQMAQFQTLQNMMQGMPAQRAPTNPLGQAAAQGIGSLLGNFAQSQTASAQPPTQMQQTQQAAPQQAAPQQAAPQPAGAGGFGQQNPQQPNYTASGGGGGGGGMGGF